MRRCSGVWLCAVTLGLASSGCYYGHLARGQLALWWAREPVDRVIEATDTPESLRHRLELAQEVRRYAAELGLEVGGQYTSYVPWQGDRLVTNLVATRPGELTPAGFWFPIVGRLPYKGYFDRDAAEAEAERLREDGLDVCVSPVVAYSTLGWTDDPLTGPLVRRPRHDDELVETLIHELVHATVYWPEDADLSESVASFIGEEGAVRFYRDRGDAESADRARARVDDDRRIAAEILGLRSRLESLYAEAGRSGGDRASGDADEAVDAHVRGLRAALEDDARSRIAALDLRVRPAADIARGARLSDACLALRGTYAADAPAHAVLYDALGRDLHRLITRLRETNDADDPREAWFAGPD